MLEAAYQPVIGRHGLISDGFLLWKVGVQHVYNASEKLVEFYPHNPHRHRGKTIQPILVPTEAGLYTEDTQLKPTNLSTPKVAKLTDQSLELYSQSTPPTITTTIYINRRGTEQ